MRSIALSLLSLVITAITIFNAYYQKKQFYPTVVYITKSNPSMTVIYFQSLVLVLMLGKLTRKIFLGTLRAAEVEHLMERFWYALTETCLAFTVFRDDFNPKFIALFTVLLFLKSFHWLAEERVDYMERSPVIGWLFHVRVAGLLNVLGILDYLLISYAYQSTISKGATVQLVFGFEYAILFTLVANTAIKYIFHAAELRSEVPWENKAVFLLYTELVIGLIRVILYFVFVFLMVKIYTLPLFAIRPMYYTIRNFRKALNDVILSRRAIRNMNTLYPDATPEELAMSDNICIICREDMVSSSKKLPCGHIFHTACLRSWFQRQQTCPTCRLNILRTPIAVAPVIPAPAVVATNNANDNRAPVANNATTATGTNTSNDNNLNNPPNTNDTNPQVAVNNPFATFLSPTMTPMNFAMPNMPPNAAVPFSGIFPTFPFMPSPYAMPPPAMPPALDTLTDDEIRAMEGTERHHVEERIKLLRNIQTLLDASVALMQQYSAITARLPQIPVTVPPPPATVIPDAVSSTSKDTTDLGKVRDNVVDKPSTSAAAMAASTSVAESSTSSKVEELVKIEDIGSEDSLDYVDDLSDNDVNNLTPRQTTNEMNEIRRRRLEKFEAGKD